MDTEPSRPAAARIQELSASERGLLSHLLRHDGRASVDEAAAALGVDPVKVRSAASWLASKGFCAIEEEARVHVAPSEEARRYAEHGLPERRLWDHLRASGGRQPMDQARAESGLTPAEFAIALAWWQRKQLGTIEKQANARVIVAADAAKGSADEEALQRLVAAGTLGQDEAAGPGFDMLRQRKGLLAEREDKHQHVRVLPKLGLDADALDAASDLVEEITPEVLRDGSWRDKGVRPFDVTAPAPRALPGKPHPLQQIIQEVRQIFLEMGFEEIDYDLVQSTFWNLDALFIPQDHPAREMQDTFYLKHPERVPVPKGLVKRVADVHRTGGDTGSRGWGGTFDPEESRRALLRTHTTVGTIRYLAQNPDKPCRVFSVGRVFRSETMDSTHLPEFHQVEGIATEPGANFRQLVGILTEFYKRLGFDKVRVRPGYFPYTEPSMEVDVFYNDAWMELGGSGIFRPEVTEPLGVKTPVLAWGLGLERLGMMRLGLTDIRDLYVSDLEWLRGQPLL
jgi:phenylalanyl-tRNA synthetase alpha chain